MSGLSRNPVEVVQTPGGLRVKDQDGKWFNVSGTLEQYKAYQAAINSISAPLQDFYGTDKYSDLELAPPPTIYSDKTTTQEVVNTTTGTLTDSIPRPETAQATPRRVSKFRVRNRGGFSWRGKRLGTRSNTPFRTRNI